MSVAIKKALMNLDKAVNNAESVLTKRRRSPVKPVAAAPDLFSAMPRQALGTGLGFDRNLLAQKLDMTIAKVEQLLGEAS